LIEAQRTSAAPMFTPVVIETAAPSQLPPPLPAAAAEPGTIEISVGATTIRIRGAVDAKTLAVVLKALRANS
jgi:hypothetical protein